MRKALQSADSANETCLTSRAGVRADEPGLRLPSDYEVPVRATVDRVVGRDDGNLDRIALYGPSLGVAPARMDDRLREDQVRGVRLRRAPCSLTPT
jgi:hypothetical protein